MKKFVTMAAMLVVSLFYGASVSHLSAAALRAEPAQTPSTGPDDTDDGDSGSHQNDNGPDSENDNGGCGDGDNTDDNGGPDSTDSGDSF
jgi:hypothetical protein